MAAMSRGSRFGTVKDYFKVANDAISIDLAGRGGLVGRAGAPARNLLVGGRGEEAS